MTATEETLFLLDEFLVQHRLRYTVIGGIAVIAHGYQRITQDIVIVATDFQSLRDVSKIVLQNYIPRRENPEEFMERNFVLPVTDRTTGVPVDISAGLGGFDQAAVKRSRRFEFG